MSDPDKTPDAHRPPRAEPVQPDIPGSGGGPQDTAEPGRDTDARQRRQSSDALENISEGYD